MGITAGRERYYRRDIALGDGARGVEATVSSAVPGVPPGVWHGQTADWLGLSGVVSDEQMKALFGLGMHPNAAVLVARELGQGGLAEAGHEGRKAWTGRPRLVLDQVSERLCRPLTKAEMRAVRQRTAAHAFTAEYHWAPAYGAELGRFLAARSGPQRRAVTGYDLTFSSEELSLLFALARSRGTGRCPRGDGRGRGVAGAACARGTHRTGRLRPATGRAGPAGHRLPALRVPCR
ncbi:relaxase domain-containing protein [Streptomyces sp. PanSC9]|uniref:relaxase domain-containing protein n=1 Tax=Streptomyces sp. PanSC9 TaxID=1520461 RepID=UPI0021A7A041|nr:relaxase domain-containing protein [Streptomyces sp. PanSC9]